MLLPCIFCLLSFKFNSLRLKHSHTANNTKKRSAQAWMLDVPRGHGLETQNLQNERPSKPLSESLCRWPTNAILRLRRCHKQKKKVSPQTITKGCHKLRKNSARNKKKTKNVKTKENRSDNLINHGRHSVYK